MSKCAQNGASSWLNLHKFLSVFGDSKPHTFQEIHWFGYNLFNRKAIDYKPIFKKCLDNCWVLREQNSGIFEGDAFTLSKKGDLCLREWAIRLGGNEGYYRNFDRSPESYAKYADEIKGAGANV